MKTFKIYWETTPLYDDGDFYEAAEGAWIAFSLEYEQRLKEAEEVIAFYADYQNLLTGPETHIFEGTRQSYITAGQRAREYQGKYQEKK